MNFKLGELKELFYNIKNIIDYVERFQIYSNNTKINLVIPKKSIPHFLEN